MSQPHQKSSRGCACKPSLQWMCGKNRGWTKWSLRWKVHKSPRNLPPWTSNSPDPGRKDLRWKTRWPKISLSKLLRAYYQNCLVRNLLSEERVVRCIVMKSSAHLPQLSVVDSGPSSIIVCGTSLSGMSSFIELILIWRWWEWLLF